MDIISTTECNALKLEYNKEKNTAQQLRIDVLRVLKMAQPVEDNLTREERVALNTMKKDEKISIYPYDKGVGMVRIDKEEAIKKIREQIGDTEIINEDPTPKFAKEVRSKLCEINKRGKFSKAEYRILYPSDPIPPRMYGTVKAHKPEKNYPMRIVVSTIGTPTHKISEYLVKLAQPTLNKNPVRIKNSRTFVEMAKSWNIEKDEVQVSYDVVNLYPKVPIKKSIGVFMDMLNADPVVRTRTKLSMVEIKELVELCLSKCYFIWNEEVHQLKDSGPIGLSIMVVIAECFLQFIEKQALEEAIHQQPPIDIKSFHRYVDDSHARFPVIRGAEEFLEVLNRQDSNIKYTIEVEDESKQLDFLDVRIINNREGKYEFKIHRKKAITNVQLKPSSSHDPKVLRGTFTGFVNRAFALCSEAHLQEELDFLTTVFAENGYKKRDLEEIITEVKRRMGNNHPNANQLNAGTQEGEEENKGIVTLPWIPKVSPRLRKVYKKAGLKVVFKSGANLRTILTTKNKTCLPKNSYPGVYRIPCSGHPDKNPYIGETKMKVSTRLSQHYKDVIKGDMKPSGVVHHSKECTDTIDWEKATTIVREHRWFPRKVREALEIQYHNSEPENGGMNLDAGSYVKTNFWKPMFQFLRKNQRKPKDLTSNNEDEDTTQ